LGPAACAEAECLGLLPRLQSNDFKIVRDLDEYNFLLRNSATPSFIEILRALPKNSLYLDAGAGEAHVLREVIKNFAALGIQKLRALGVSYKKPTAEDLESDHKNFSDRFDYIDGDVIENLLHNSRLINFKGQVDLISDIHGPLSYTDDIAAILNTYADLLKVGGHAMIYLYEGNSSFLVDRRVHFSRVTLRELHHFIPLITGGRLEVVEARMHIGESNLPIFYESVFYLKRVEPKEEQVKINPFELVGWKDEAPPIREFRVQGLENLDLDKLRKQDLDQEKPRFKKIQVHSSFLM
jgi:SAM-dependent methyltransferase